MKVSDKILLVWLAFMWTVFSIWLVAIITFPLNFGCIAFQFLTGIILVWAIKPIYVRSEVPSE